LTDFETTILPHFDSAYSLARYLLRHTQDAEDVVQEAFLKAWRHFGTFRGTNPRAWLLTIVRRTCYSHGSKRQSEPVEADEESPEPAARAADGPEAGVLRAELGEILAQSVNELPVALREVIVLREVEEMSYQEIATVQGVPIGTVMSRLSRARTRLQQTLDARGMGA